jgi:hypothetical protein
MRAPDELSGHPFCSTGQSKKRQVRYSFFLISLQHVNEFLRFAFNEIFIIILIIHHARIQSQVNGVIMEEQQPLPPAPSIGSAIMNVFSAPGDAFANLDSAESKPMHWILPLIVCIAAIIIMTIIGFSNQSLKSQRLEATRITLEQRVTQGKMTQEQFDRTMEGMEKGGGIILAVSVVAITIMIAIFFFISALLLWLGSKFVLKLPVGYGKILELSGIATWIGVLGIVLQMLMMIGLDSIYAQPNAAIFFYQNFDITNSLHKTLAALNFFSIWQTIVIGIGLQQWSKKTLLLPMVVSFAVWLLITGLTLSMGFAG